MTSESTRRARRLSTPPLRTPQSAAEAAARPKLRPGAAVIAVHGMGQQTKYDTMASLAGLLYDITNSGESPRGPIEVVNRTLDNGRSQVCSEFSVSTRDGSVKDVAVFEAYWAPFAEGKIGFFETIWFLFVSALWGIWLTVKDGLAGHRFQRWVFESVRSYPVSWATLPLLAVTSAGVIGITLIMAAALAALFAKLASFVAQAFFRVPLDVAQSPLVAQIDELQKYFAWVMLLMFAVGIAVIAVVGALRRIGASAVPGAARWVLIGLVIVVALTAGASGFALAGITLQAALPLVLAPDTRFGALLAASVSGARELLQFMVGYVPLLLQWPIEQVILVNVGAFLVVYFFGKQFVGDVAIYVSAHRVNRYWEARDNIRGAALEVARGVYECKEGDGFRYDEVYFIAHSLGSVIAYDTINAILRDELVMGKRIDALNRTKGLLTYGSPLDKTAFLFRAYSSGSVERLAAVAAGQPLIVSEVWRRLKWINIHSVADPISGAVEYYGPPGDACVINRNDRQSFVPLLAHVQYENHETFHDALRELLDARDASSRALSEKGRRRKRGWRGRVRRVQTQVADRDSAVASDNTALRS